MQKQLLATIPRPGRDVQWREFGSEAIVLDVATGQYIQIDATGIAIWREIDGRRTVEELAAIVASDFDTTVDVVLDDVTEFVEELSRNRLVVLSA